MCCNFFLLPCCPFDFFGAYQKRVEVNASNSAYASYMNYIRQICVRLVVHFEKTRDHCVEFCVFCHHPLVSFMFIFASLVLDCRLGFIVEEDRLKIPSTKRHCFIGLVPDSGLVKDLDSVIKVLLSTSGKMRFVPREKFEKVRFRYVKAALQKLFFSWQGCSSE